MIILISYLKELGVILLFELTSERNADLRGQMRQRVVVGRQTLLDRTNLSRKRLIIRDKGTGWASGGPLRPPRSLLR